MSYDDDEKSTSNNRPIELYSIVAGLVTYRYTSWPADYVYDGDTYTAIPIKRSSTASVGHQDQPELTVEMPVSTQFIQDIAFDLPPQSVVLTILRLQQVSGVALTLWTGAVVGIMASGRIAKLRVPTLLADSSSILVSAVHAQRMCNHILYDARCQIVRADFDVATTVSSLSGAVVTVASDGGNVDQWFRGGELVIGGERRTITDHTGNAMTLLAPMYGVSAGNAVTLYAGCDHSIAMCKDKFDNVTNFGGHPQLYWRNPFVTWLAWKK